MTNNHKITPVSLQKMTVDLIRKTHVDSFPFWVFPNSVQRIIEETNSKLGFPIDFISASIFFTCALANGNATRVKVKETWHESTVMYMCLVGRSGTNKSHPLSWALKPIEKFDEASHQTYVEDMHEYENRGKNDEKDGKVPFWKHIIVSDFTIEALIEIHKNNRRGLSVYADELSGWIANMNRYNAGSELQFWLSQWSQKTITNDRKSSRSNFITNPFISVIGTIQNGIIQDISTDKNNKNGFTDRILWVIPNNLKKEVWRDEDLDPEIVQSYENLIVNILKLQKYDDGGSKTVTNIIEYDPDAFEELKKWQASNAKRYNSRTNDIYDGIISKHDNHINRLALTLQIMFDTSEKRTPSSVTINAVHGAIEISNYFFE